MYRSQTKQEIAPPSHVVERYIELLCRYTPEAVYNFLKANDSYRLEEALDVSTMTRCDLLCLTICLNCVQVCSKARLNDATSYLLERSGDAMGAFKLILEVSFIALSHTLTSVLRLLPCFATDPVR